MSPSKKTCMVCGDKALGYNFNAITCESCKAFFRRNALLTKEFTCPFSQNCEITVITRRFCQRCRLEKCFQIGMKKEHIMSEEDKNRKKRKIELNRVKRKMTGNVDSEPEVIIEKIKREDASSFDAWSERDDGQSPSCDYSNSSISSETRPDNSFAPEFAAPAVVTAVSSTTESQKKVSACICSAEEIVDSIVGAPENGGRAINLLMKTPKEALEVMTKIINSPSDAMKLISHLISYPGDALKIISKIMNSPFDALTVFTKFMSSPTDALEIISKIANSPGDVLQFIQQLMSSPEDALEIMNKFINSPAEALRMINKMVNYKVDSTTETCEANQQAHDNTSSYTVINSVLNSVQSPNSSSSSSASLSPDAVMPIANTDVRDIVINDPAPGNSFAMPADVQISSGGQPNVAAGSSTMTPPAPMTANQIDDEAMKNILGDVQDGRPIEPNSIESALCEAIKLEYETFSSLPQTCGENRALNEAEQAKLNELFNANKALYLLLDDDMACMANDEGRTKSDSSAQDPQLLKVINLTAIAIRRLIKMSKKINAFRNMCQEDQIALLKGGCTEMMIMRSVMTYDCAHATWKIPHSKEDMSSIKADVLKLVKGNVYDELDRFIRTFELKWRTDENIILIMCAILLFTPTRPRAVHSDVIKLEQNSYYYLLRRYLESIYPGCEAKSTFIKLIQKITEVQRLNEVIIGVYLNVNPSQVEPLLREIFDLKN